MQYKYTYRRHLLCNASGPYYNFLRYSNFRNKALVNAFIIMSCIRGTIREGMANRNAIAKLINFLV